MLGAASPRPTAPSQASSTSTFFFRLVAPREMRHSCRSGSSITRTSRTGMALHLHTPAATGKAGSPEVARAISQVSARRAVCSGPRPMNQAVRVVVAALVLLVATTAWARRPGALDRSAPRAVQLRELRGVEREVTHLVRLGRRPVVVFDIDDTLVYSRRPGAIAGAAAYARRLAARGAKVVYLTGRQEKDRAITVAHLRRHG